MGYTRPAVQESGGRRNCSGFNVMAKPESLPIEDVLPAVAEALRRGSNCVIAAPPGAGKTTRVPPALVREGLVPGALIMLQPRRVAARAAARRIAEENGWTVGGEVGYQVRFERSLSEKTRIRIVTEGILTRRLQSDPFLEGIDAVLFDEFHLRSLDGDVGLALLREVQRTVRPEIRLVVMSATLDTGPASEFLGGCPVIECAGRLHPIDIRYEARPSRTLTDDRVARAVRQCVASRPDGHVLVFLPGAREIRRCRNALEDLVGAAVLPLHGSLSSEDQDRAVRPESGRAVILATNVAETSLTIPGVTAVVDSGLVRLEVFDPRTGIDRLETRRVSADSAEQRAGRAGRTGPGTVFRLWTKGQQKELLPRTPPEIRRVDLSRLALELAAWGADPKSFGWFEPPDPAVIEAARELLLGLGALDGNGRITALGKKLVALPLHPRIGRLVIEAHARGFMGAGALIAAILSERDILRRRIDGGKAATVGPSDVLLRYDILAEGRATGANVDRGAASRVQRVRRDLQRIVTATLGRAKRRQPDEEDLLRLVFCAYPDRVVRRREKGGDRGVMSGGRGVRLASGSIVRDAEFFAAVDLDGAGADARVHLASAIDPDWLELTEETVLAFDAERERVTAVRRDMYHKLCVREAAVPPDPEEAARILAQAAAADVERALKPAPEALSFMARVECLREWMPELDLPAMDAGFLESLLPELCAGARGFDDLRRVDLAARLKGALSYDQLSAVERNAPERIAVPSGSKIRLDYEPGRAPILAVQLQNLFGLADTPTVAGGRVRVLLHLLAPSRRPVQVTQDLASFWKNTYAQVRKDLRARYPKHAWPEDPLAAAPESRPRRRKGGR